MTNIPDEVLQAWELREGPAVLTTVDADGKPNAIYANSVRIFNGDTIVVADNYFFKTLNNIQAGSQGALLFLAPEKKSFQLKGRIEYHTSGEIYDFMKTWNSPKHPGKAAAALRVEEVYSGANRLA